MNRREFVTAVAAVPVAFAVDPRALAARLGGVALAFVTADLESRVVVIDLGSGRTVAGIRTAPGPRSIESARRSVAVVAHTEHGVVSMLDAVSHEIREDDTFASPRYTAVHPVRPIAYVTDSARGEVVALDLERGKVVSRTAVPGPARHLSISPDGRMLWTALGTAAERVAVLDSANPRRPRLVRTITPPFLAHDVVFSSDGRRMWVTSGSERRIALYGRGRGRPLRVIAAGAPPQHVTFARDKAFVASGDDGTVRRHGLDGELVREANVPLGSYNVACGFGHVVTPSLGEGTVSLLDRNGHVREIRRVARAAHDACVLLGP
jgi:DNA-binding beta-propeller fold protein YncE